MKLLYAEDEPAMAEAVADVLTYHNYLVDRVADGEEALDYARSETYDGIILDVMMPRLDGLAVVETLRREGCRTPVLLLTAKGEVEDRIRGLDLGADDYLPKPFAMGELLARVRAMLRRRQEFVPEVLTCGDVTLNLGSFQLACGDKSAVLPKMEYRLMETLMRNQGLYLSSEDLLVKVWGYNAQAEIGTVWVYISYLRKRLAALGSRVTVKARRGVGYTLEAGG
ncbi:response regulator transcription factor [Evtepia sp.]|uniref:response regulator transcription factor n=1 Tax=Evtepia sp. TaxID=2773933 RepID=UPI002A80B5B4|nr:response regulator transcription factor [Evtepia sp.]MDY4430813.1 response regulator transcription factor [Evtepia sp.]